MSIIIHLSNFFNLMFKSMLSLIKIFVLSDFFAIRFTKDDNHKQSVIILGNGPSLSKDLKKVKNINNFDLFAVNHFADHNLFTSLKPSYYCINAPELFLDESNVELADRRDMLFSNLSSKTNWDMTLFVVNSAKKYYRWQDMLSVNNKIKIIYYNNTPIDGFNFFKFFMWRNNIGLPAPHNVLIPSIIQSINLSYKKIFLLGVDHSWLNEIVVSDENIVLLNQKHFYDKFNSMHKPMTKDLNNSRKLHEVLHKFYYTFRGYHEIEKFSINYYVSVYNLTTGSYIDAFKRVESC